MSTPVERGVETPHGPGRLVSHLAGDPVADLLLSHGAGGGIGARDLVALAEALPAQGYSVHLLEQPWRTAGRKIATRPPTLDDALLAALDLLTGDGANASTRRPLVLGGRSAGARSACRSAAVAPVEVAGVLALSFPLHPPGKPERSRLAELTGAGVPVLVVQGERDPMGRPEEFPDDTEMVVLAGGDHGLKVPRRGELSEVEAMGVVVEGTLEWLVREVVG